MIDIVRNPKCYRSDQELLDAYANAVSMVKMVDGVCNNATYLAMMYALEQIAEHPKYKGKVRQRFEAVVKEWKRYEGNLLYATHCRFFHVADMSAETRSKYGDITDRQYFEFWQGGGGRAYYKTRPLITSLQNKFRLSLEADGMPYPDILAWGLTASTLLDICVHMHGLAVKEMAGQWGLDYDVFALNCQPLSVEKPRKAWRFALGTLEDKVNGKIIPASTEKNIAFGVNQIYDAWSSAEGLFGSTADAITDFAEVFAGKKTMRAALANVRNMERELIEERKKLINKKILDNLKDKEESNV